MFGCSLLSNNIRTDGTTLVYLAATKKLQKCTSDTELSNSVSHKVQLFLFFA